MGPSISADTLAVFAEVRDSGTLVISPAATSNALTHAEADMATDENPGILWRTVPPDTNQGATIAADMVSRNIASIAVVYQGGAYGEGLNEAFVEALGGAIPIDVSVAFTTSSERAEAFVAAGLSAAQEVLFISPNKVDVQAFYTVAKNNANYNGKTLFLTDAAASADLVDANAATLIDRIRGTRPQPLDKTDPVLNIFSAGYSGVFGSDPTVFSFTAHAYDAAWLVLYGASRSLQLEQRVTGHGIARGIRRLSEGPDVNVKPSSWQVVKQAMALDERVNIHGASGKLDYDPITEETSAPIELWHIIETAPGVFAIRAIDK